MVQRLEKCRQPWSVIVGSAFLGLVGEVVLDEQQSGGAGAAAYLRSVLESQRDGLTRAGVS